MDKITKVGADLRFEGDEALGSALYNLLLDRKPDPIGYRNFREMLRAETLNGSSLVESFLQSEEFVGRHPRLIIQPSIPKSRIASEYGPDILPRFVDPGASVKPTPGFRDRLHRQPRENLVIVDRTAEPRLIGIT
jgi:hypothetical protein